MPEHPNFRAASRANYLPDHVATLEQINAGSLQRIADATETMAKHHVELIAERDRLARWFAEEQAATKHLRGQVAAYKAVATKLRKQLAAVPASTPIAACLNALIWKLPLPPGCDTAADFAALMLAELADKGIHGLVWEPAREVFVSCPNSPLS